MFSRKECKYYSERSLITGLRMWNDVTVRKNPVTDATCYEEFRFYKHIFHISHFVPIGYNSNKHITAFPKAIWSQECKCVTMLLSEEELCD
jgi:hypothetical protein